MKRWIAAVSLLTGLAITGALSAAPVPKGAPMPQNETDPPEIALGKRLFRDTRFNQFYATHSGGDANRTLPARSGDLGDSDHRRVVAQPLLGARDELRELPPDQ